MSASQPSPAAAEEAEMPESWSMGSGGGELPGHDILCVEAPNPGPLTLGGTNTWIIGRDPAWIVDPGPLIETHLQRIVAALSRRGGLGGVALTHDHHDHGEAVDELLARVPAPLAAARGRADVRISDGGRFGPFEAIATPGHASDHFALIAGPVCFTGDAVLGAGSVFVSPQPGAMTAYLGALDRLIAREEIEVLCPGHGPPVWEPRARLAQYIEHRLDRERRLIAALAEGRRSVAELLDTVWADVPRELRGAATATLAAHLERLKELGELPDGVEWPDFEKVEW